jgi:hypothetical protein
VTPELRVAGGKKRKLRYVVDLSALALGEHSATITIESNGGTATANFDRLPPGQVTVEGAAYPNANGTGTIQAQAQTTATIVSGQVAQIRLTLASTIDRIEVTPTSVSLAPGQTSALTATAKNAAGEVVLTHSSTISWVSQNTSIATVAAGGNLAGSMSMTVA